MIEPARAPDRASRSGQRPLPLAGAIGRSEMRAARIPGLRRLLRLPTTSVAPVPKALACVMGDLDLVRPLGLAGIACAAVTRPGNPSIYSRFVRAALCWDDFSEGMAEIVEALVRFASAQPEPPVLFYGEDAQLLLVSRYRRRLAKAFRFAVPDPTLVEELVDKARFQLLAERLCLPVPPMRRVFPVEGSRPPDLDLRFPIIIKPLTRTKRWDAIWNSRKALMIESAGALRHLWPCLARIGMDMLAQELVPGPESRVESYHVYVDRLGAIAGEFTGRKIRTLPLSCGHSSALETTDSPDVMALGRDLVRRLDLRGVAKFDFKRGPDGGLHLLEVNPRFNLWHHLGAMAGVNLPAMVYADMTGLPRPAATHARAGVCWCRPWTDRAAARQSGTSFAAWLRWALACEAKSVVALDDPMPLLGGILARLVPGWATAWRPQPTECRISS